MFYDVFTSLCGKKGVSPNKALTDCGISRTSTAKWREGATPRGVTLQKLADYFDVSTDYLLTGEKKKKTPTSEGERVVSDEDIMFALWGNTDDVNKDDLDDVKRYAAFIRERKNRE